MNQENGPEIVVRLHGGLGNQLFQISLAIKLQSLIGRGSIFLDSRFLKSYETKRNIEIGFLLNHVSGVASDRSPHWLNLVASRFRFGRLLNCCIGYFSFIGTTQKLFSLKLGHFKYFVLDGYFQNPTTLIDEGFRLRLRDILFSERRVLLQSVRKESVSMVGIHIRRGDYVSSKAASGVFRTISIDYYREAVKSFGADVKFIVFSDDHATASAFADEVNGLDATSMALPLADEFCLLAACDHYIIANSTFSWWASYLGGAPGKRVISPRRWYLDEKRNIANPLLLSNFELISIE